MFFKESGYLYRKCLSSNDKKKLENIIKKYKKPESVWNTLEDFFIRGQLIDYIDYQNLSNNDLLFVCKILIKTLSEGTGHFTIMPDHRVFIEYMAQRPPNRLTDQDRELLYFNYINNVLLLVGEKPPNIHPKINAVLHPIFDFSLGPSFAGFVAFPLLEAICRAKSIKLTRGGLAMSEINETIRGRIIKYRPNGRVSSLEHELLLMEQEITPFLRSILEELDSELNLYNRVYLQRCSQLHGATLRSWESWIVIFLLYIIYIGEKEE